MKGLFDLMDQAVCEFLHITQEQLEYITVHSDEDGFELEKMMEPAFKEHATISEVKLAIQIRDKYLKQNGLWIELAPQTSAE
jgi:hypothetical protein